VKDRRGSLGLALADRRIALAGPGHARDDSKDVARHEAVAAYSRSNLESHPDVHILDLLRHSVDAGESDGGKDRERVASYDLGGRTALCRDPGPRDDPPVALLDLGVECRLELRARQVHSGRDSRRNVLARLEGDDSKLPVRIVEVDSDRLE